jgi:uncharacterized surface anchored protein
VLQTKWNTALPADQAADISYLLLRYGNTTSNDESAALAHLLHTWTAPPTVGHPTSGVPKEQLAYDSTFHLNALPASAKATVSRLLADATANGGPWSDTLTAPTTPQVIGTPGNWTVKILNKSGKGEANVTVKVTGTDATVPATVTTGADGTAVITATPTTTTPSVGISFASPNDQPRVSLPVGNPDVQKVVLTGGEKQLTTTTKGTAKTKPGAVTVTKVDSATGKPLAGVRLEITGADKKSAAIKQDGTKLVDSTGAPLTVTTGADGTATIADLATPQTITLIEVVAPAGYNENYDPNNPPSVSGEVQPGSTLALKLANKANAPKPSVSTPTPTVPVKINAGGSPTGAIATAAVVSEPRSGAVLGMGALLVIGAAVGGSVYNRRRAIAKNDGN